MTEVRIERKFKTGQKIYFDLVVGKVRINHCFVERGNKGDWMLRLPTKNTPTGVHQAVWFDDKETFNHVCNKVRNHFEGDE